MLAIIGKIFSPLAYVLNSFLMKLFILIDEPHEKIFANFFIIILFAGVYYGIYMLQFQLKGKEVIYSPYSNTKMDFFDAIYFSFVVHFTLGFGDVFPVSTSARIAVILHTTLFWFINLIDSDLVQKVAKQAAQISPSRIHYVN